MLAAQNVDCHGHGHGHGHAPHERRDRKSRSGFEMGGMSVIAIVSNLVTDTPVACQTHSSNCHTVTHPLGSWNPSGLSPRGAPTHRRTAQLPKGGGVKQEARSAAKVPRIQYLIVGWHGWHLFRRITIIPRVRGLPLPVCRWNRLFPRSWVRSRSFSSRTNSSVHHSIKSDVLAG